MHLAICSYFSLQYNDIRPYVHYIGHKYWTAVVITSYAYRSRSDLCSDWSKPPDGVSDLDQAFVRGNSHRTDDTVMTSWHHIHKVNEVKSKDTSFLGVLLQKLKAPLPCSDRH